MSQPVTQGLQPVGGGLLVGLKLLQLLYCLLQPVYADGQDVRLHPGLGQLTGHLLQVPFQLDVLGAVPC